MLVAVSGSQGLGKSVLIEELRTAHNFKVIERKTSRSILSEWGVTLSEVNNNRPLTLKFQDEILARKIADEAAAIASDDVYVTERSFADLFTYAVAAIGKDNECSDWLDEYFEKCRAAQNGYAFVFYLKNSGRFSRTIQNDGVRAINWHYSQMIDLTMAHYTDVMSGNRTVPIYHGGLDERCAVINTTLARR